MSVIVKTYQYPQGSIVPVSIILSSRLLQYLLCHKLLGLFQTKSIQTVTKYQIFEPENYLFFTINIFSKIGQICLIYYKFFNIKQIVNNFHHQLY